MQKPRSILALISAAGGGDAPPVVALALGLRDRGDRVTIICDAATQQLVRDTNLDTIVVPPESEQGAYFQRWSQRWGREIPDETTNPVDEWGELCLPVIEDSVAKREPDLIIGSLLCMGLADALAKSLDIPWCFVNPAFYFGELQNRPWEEDYYGPYVQWLVRDCLWPLSQRADIVLHATDRSFDFPPTTLPARHRYTGFLLWEPTMDLPDFVEQPGNPWALVTVSTLPQEDELSLARTAAWALGSLPVRTLLTLPYEQAQNDIGDLPENTMIAGFVPHGRMLENCSLVVTHAGHGIVSKALYHGVPMVLLPWDRDQPGVADRAVRFGVGEIVRREDLAPELVHETVSRVLGDPRYRDRAAQISSRLRGLDAVGTACQILEGFLAQEQRD
jgi:UDP:flavonoid glycosyltransferase YjiC (YdhE family)